ARCIPPNKFYGRARRARRSEASECLLAALGQCWNRSQRALYTVFSAEPAYAALSPTGIAAARHSGERCCAEKSGHTYIIAGSQCQRKIRSLSHFPITGKLAVSAKHNHRSKKYAHSSHPLLRHRP